MPRAFLIKKKVCASVGSGRPMSPKLYSPASSGIASPNSSNSSTSSASPRNDENDLTTFQASSPKYSFDRESQCLDLSMKSLLKEANNKGDKLTQIEHQTPFNSSLYNEPSFVSSYSYPSKFAKIAGFLRTGEASRTAAVSSFAQAIASRVPSGQSVPSVNPIASQASPASASSLYKPVNYHSIDNSSAASCPRLAPYSINWSEHFSVNKLVSPTPSSQGSDDSGRGSEHSEDNSDNQSPAKCGKLSKKSDRYQCVDCNKSYSTQSGLAKHQEFHCSSQVKKSFSCKHCEKVYVSLGALKMHIRTHTLPCKCKLCGKAFSRPWLLQGHIRTHTGEKPFACQHCNRAFADRSNLRAHLQTHSIVKKYNCKCCSRTFSRMSLLLKHEDNGCNAGSSRDLSACSPISEMSEATEMSLKVE